MIIEFVGLPGCGKTTASRALFEAATLRGLDARWVDMAPSLWSDARGAPRLAGRIQLTAARLRSIARHRRLVAAATAAVIKSKRSFAEKVYTLRHLVVTLHAATRARATDEPGQLSLLPEGLCQRAFMSFVDGTGTSDERLAARFVDDMPASDIVVLLEVSPPVALRRVRDRGTGPLSYRFGDMDDPETADRLAAGQRFFLALVERLAASSPEVVVLEADDLAAALEELCDHRLPAWMESPDSK